MPKTFKSETQCLLLRHSVYLSLIGGILSLAVSAAHCSQRGWIKCEEQMSANRTSNHKTLLMCFVVTVIGLPIDITESVPFSWILAITKK